MILSGIQQEIWTLLRMRKGHIRSWQLGEEEEEEEHPAKWLGGWKGTTPFTPPHPHGLTNGHYQTKPALEFYY